VFGRLLQRVYCVGSPHGEYGTIEETGLYTA
jgi:hypothetical protein